MNPIFQSTTNSGIAFAKVQTSMIQTVQESVETFQTIATQEESQNLDVRLETIKSIIDAEETFLRSLSPEQESTIVDALYFYDTNLIHWKSQRFFTLDWQHL